MADRRSLFGAPTLSGSLLALLFWWHSLTPTLIPRSWELQVAIGGVCLAIGYGIGTLAGSCVQRLVRRRFVFDADVIRRRSRIVLGAAWIIAILFGAPSWMRWQNEQRDFMGMGSVDWWDGVLIGALSPVAGALLVVIGRAIAKAFGAIHRSMRRRVSSAALAISALLIVILAIVFGRVVALRALAAVASSVFAPANEETTEGSVVPRSASVSGSTASLVAWDTLGRMGRDFVASATSEQQLSMFHGADAMLAVPVRVYVGVRSADSLEEQAKLAVLELERAGGFERKVLVVCVPTGTGWVVPKAATALELLHRGDTAIVAIQYSYLPSLLGVFVHAGRARQAGLVLFNAVRARWLELPHDRRPKLVLFGKSLGAEGVEAPFEGVDAAASIANIVARTDGVLIAGAARSNTIHLQLTRERDPGSPVWAPVFDEGRSVRFLTRDPNQPAMRAEWSTPRIVYLQHGSDPVAFWSLEALWRPPEWMEQPRAFDVPDALHWFPIVSSVQSVGDFLDQLGPPPGFGHDYANGYVKGWASIVPPEGWTPIDTERLEHFIDELPGDDSEP